jgi:hypothetical protein
MADTLTLLGLLLNFAGALLLLLHRFPSLEITADGRSLVPLQGEPAPEARARNLRRYWRHAVATRAGLVCLCAGFALQLLGFVYPDYDAGAGGAAYTARQISSCVAPATNSSPASPRIFR